MEILVATAIMGLLMGAGVLLYRQFSRVAQKTMASLESRESLTACLQLISDRVQESNSSGVRVSSEQPPRGLSVSRATGLSTQGNLTWSNDLCLFWFDQGGKLMHYRVCSPTELQALPLAADGRVAVAPTPAQMIRLMQAPTRPQRRFPFQDGFFDLDPAGTLRVTLQTRNTTRSMTVTRAFHFKL